MFAALALALAAAGTLAAQTIALTNIGSSVSGATAIGANPEVRSQVVSFTTGSSATSFDFTGIDFQFGTANGAATGLTVELYDSGFSIPSGTGDLITGLTLTSGNPTVAGVSSFSGTASLVSGTTYYVKLFSNDILPNSNISYTLNAGSASYTGLSDWAYGDMAIYFNGSLVLASSGFATLLTINATPASAIPEPSTYATLVGAAMLGLAVWGRRQNPSAAA